MQDAQAVDAPPRALQYYLSALLGLWGLGTAALIWLLLVFPNQARSGPNKDFVITLPPRHSLEALAVKLREERVIEHAWAFRAYMRLLGAEAHLRSGDVVINRSLPVRAHLARLADGYGIAQVRVPIPEGFTRFDVARRMGRYGVCSEAEFERATRHPALLQTLQLSGESAEGYLFPATYELAQGSACEAVVREMVRVFRERTKPRFARYARERDGAPHSLTPHELLTLASIVEREARVPQERPRIAGVFMNRLTSPTFKPRRLQADPTVAYGCLVDRERIPSCSTYDGRKVTPAMVRDPENRYSTYRHEGLPPGPICNPGLSALDAALWPEAHDFFYFVTSGGGAHAFTHSLQEHNARVRGEPAAVVP